MYIVTRQFLHPSLLWLWKGPLLLISVLSRRGQLIFFSWRFAGGRVQSFSLIGQADNCIEMQLSGHFIFPVRESPLGAECRIHCFPKWLLYVVSCSQWTWWSVQYCLRYILANGWKIVGHTPIVRALASNQVVGSHTSEECWVVTCVPPIQGQYTNFLYLQTFILSMKSKKIILR